MTIKLPSPTTFRDDNHAYETVRTSAGNESL